MSQVLMSYQSAESISTSVERFPSLPFILGMHQVVTARVRNRYGAGVLTLAGRREIAWSRRPLWVEYLA
ncbi:hypothetical protein D3C84_1182690 [compost metagenome]